MRTIINTSIRAACHCCACSTTVHEKIKSQVHAGFYVTLPRSKINYIERLNGSGKKLFSIFYFILLQFYFITKT